MAYAQLDGVRLYYESAGTGRPVVLVNSMGTTLRTWDRVIADLAADHHVTGYDWRGCGRSERASDELRAWTARQVLDASPHTDALYAEQTRYDPRPWLPDLTVPVCYVHGTLDKAVPISIARELAALTPRSTLIPVEGAGHMAHQEAPAEVAAAIRALARQSTRERTNS